MYHYYYYSIYEGVTDGTPGVTDGTPGALVTIISMGQLEVSADRGVSVMVQGWVLVGMY